MPEKNSFIIRVSDFVSKYSIYALVFLLPVFFLSWTSDVLDFNKQALLLFLVSLSFFAWILKIIVLKKININLNKIHIFVAVLFFVYLLSTIFSLWRYGSFWGWPQNISESLVTLIGLCFFYILVSNIFTKKDIFNLALLLSFSTSLALLIGFLQIFGLFLFPFNFARTVLFNTVGIAGALGFFIIALLPLIFALLTHRKLPAIILFWTIIFTLILLITLNYWFLWWLALIGSALIIIFGIQKKTSPPSLVFPMLFLALSLFFIILKPTINFLPLAPIEVSLNQKTSLEIDIQTLKERPIFGSGPGTFGYDFAKYKKTDFNVGNLFWNMRFGGAGSKILTILATIGILGILSFLVLVLYIVFSGIKFFFIQESKDDYWDITLGVFISFIVLNTGFFLRNSNLTLDFLQFFLIAAFVALTSKERKEYSLEPSSLKSLSVNFIFILCFIFGFGFLLLIGQKYVAEMDYNQGVMFLQSGEVEAGVEKMEEAVGLNPSSDLYWRQLSQIYLLKMGQEVKRTDISQDERTKNVSILVNNSINASKIASDISSKNVDNWSNRGFIYQNLIGIISGTEDWAIRSYDEAINLEPNNPYYFTQKGVVFLTQAIVLNKEKEEKSQLLLQAKEQLEKAIQLKSDYAPARFQLAMVFQEEGEAKEAIERLEETKKYAPNDIGLAFQLGVLYYQNKDFSKAREEFERVLGISPNYSNALYFLGLTYYELGENDKAIEKISKVLELNPDNETVKKVLNNLKAGKKPLEGIGQETPIEESPTKK